MSQPKRLSLDDTNPWAKYRGMKLFDVVRRDPDYACWLIAKGHLLNTEEVCDAIQKEYDSRARTLSNEKDRWNWTPIHPKQAPLPVKD